MLVVETVLTLLCGFLFAGGTNGHLVVIVGFLIRPDTNHREMVRPRDGLESGLRASLAPGLGNDAALAQELARFQASGHRIEYAALGRRPEQW